MHGLMNIEQSPSTAMNNEHEPATNNKMKSSIDIFNAMNWTTTTTKSALQFIIGGQFIYYFILQITINSMASPSMMMPIAVLSVIWKRLYTTLHSTSAAFVRNKYCRILFLLWHSIEAARALLTGRTSLSLNTHSCMLYLLTVLV